MKLDICQTEDLEAVIELLHSTEIGQIYFNNNIESVGFAVRREYEKNCVLVARSEKGVIVGTLIQDKKGAFGKYPYLHMLAVSSTLQNQGIGSKIMELYEKDILGSGEKLFLLVAEWNEGAKRLYERIGYSELGRIDGFYKKDQVEIVMMKSL